LFGGTDSDDRKNDLYCYDVFTNSWELMLQQGEIPIARSGTKGIAYKSRLYFFGGYQKKSGDYYDDLFYYDLIRKRWDTIELNGDYPSERTDHSLVLYEGSIYIFGGYDG
jgi:N-acetylneuraminic acid mutarotase